MKTVTKTYFGYTVIAMRKGWSPTTWMFKIEKDGNTWQYTGVPNYCESSRSALRRGWWRAKWLADGTYNQHYQ